MRKHDDSDPLVLVVRVQPLEELVGQDRCGGPVQHRVHLQQRGKQIKRSGL